MRAQIVITGNADQIKQAIVKTSLNLGTGTGHDKEQLIFYDSAASATEALKRANKRLKEHGIKTLYLRSIKLVTNEAKAIIKLTT